MRLPRILVLIICYLAQKLKQVAAQMAYEQSSRKTFDDGCLGVNCGYQEKSQDRFVYRDIYR